MVISDKFSDVNIRDYVIDIEVIVHNLSKFDFVDLLHDNSAVFRVYFFQSAVRFIPCALVEILAEKFTYKNVAEIIQKEGLRVFYSCEFRNLNVVEEDVERVRERSRRNPLACSFVFLDVGILEVFLHEISEYISEKVSRRMFSDKSVFTAVVSADKVCLNLVALYRRKKVFKRRGVNVVCDLLEVARYGYVIIVVISVNHFELLRAHLLNHRSEDIA